MKLEAGLEQITRDTASVVTVGVFDGVHVGHQAVLASLVNRAKRCGGISTLITFDPHPRKVLHNENIQLLTTVEEKVGLLASQGLERLVVMPFTRSLAALSPQDFVRKFLYDRIGLREIIVGYDHRFGKGRAGDVNLLRQMGCKYGFDVTTINARAVGQDIVSSNKIRMHLRTDGNVRQAQAMLGRPYGLTGTVTRGEGRGHTLGYPTANLALLDSRKLIPKRGVYAVQAHWDSCKRGGMMNIGTRPTVASNGRTHLEVHLFDTDEVLYGLTLEVQFVTRIRDEIRFLSLGALREQLSHDEAVCRSLVT